MAKVFRPIGLLVLLALVTPLYAWAGAPLQIPSLDRSSAWVPWGDFREIIREINRDTALPEPPPPPALTVISAIRYKGALKGDTAAVSAAFEITTLGEEWVAVPVAPAGLAIAAPLLDGRPALIDTDGSWHRLIIFGAGKHVFTVRFFAKTGNALGPTSFAFSRLPAPVSTLDFTVPETGLDLKADPAAYNAVTNTASASRLEAALNPSGQVTVSWSRKVEAAEAELRLNAEVETLARLGEKLCQVTSMVSYEILHQGVTSFSLELPADVTVVDVTGAGLAEWRAEKDGDKQKVSVDLSFEARDRYVLTVEYEKALADVNAEVGVPELKVMNVARERGNLAVAARTTIEVELLDSKGLISLDPADLPGSLRSRSTDPILLAGSYTAHPFSMKLKTTRHQDLAGLPAVIDQMRLKSFLTREGKVLTRMNLEVKNNRSQFMRMKLPEKARLLSVYIGDRPIRASLSEDGKFLIPLDKAGSETAASFSIEVIYLQSLEALKSWRGKLSLEAPQTDIVVNDMTWDLTLPEKYEYKVDEDETSLKWNEPVSSGRKESGSILNIFLPQQRSFSKQSDMRLPAAAPEPAPAAAPPPEPKNEELAFAYYDSKPQEEADQKGHMDAYTTTEQLQAGENLSNSDVLAQDKQGALDADASTLPADPARRDARKDFWWSAYRGYHSKDRTIIMSNQAILPVRLDLPTSRGISLNFEKRVLPENEPNHILISYRKESKVSLKVIVVTAIIVILAAFIIRRRITRKNRPGFVMGVLLALMMGLMLPSLASAQPQDLPDLKGSYLSIPWSDMKSLLDLLPGATTPTPDPEPPVGFVLSSASYDAKLVKDAVEVRASMRLVVLEKTQWVLVPVLSSGVAAAEILIDGAPGLVINRDGYHNLALKGAGEHTITTRFYVAAGAGAGPKEAYVPLVMTPATSLSFTVSEPGLKLEAEPASMQTTETGAGFSRLSANIPPANQVRVSWMKKVEAKEQDLRLNADVETNIGIGEQLVSFVSVVHYEILHRGVTALKLSLPADINVVNVTGQGVADWKAETTDAVQNINVTLSYEAKERYDLTVIYEKSLPDSTAELAVPALTVSEANRERGFIAVTAEQNLEVVVKKTSALAGIDATELPGSLSGGAVVHAFKFVSPPWSLAIDITRHKDVAGLACAIDQADVTSFLTEDGQLVTRALYTIRNNREQFIRLTLPQDSRVFSSLREGRPVKPAKDSQGRVLIPLEKASDAAGLAKSFTIEVVYLTKIDKLKKRSGKLLIDLPRANVLTKALNLWVRLPVDYEWEVGDTSLDYDKDRGIPRTPSGGVTSITFGDDIGLSNVMSQMTGNEARSGEAVAGGLPVYFTVPDAGKTKFLMKSVLGEDEENTVELTYKKPCEWLQKIKPKGGLRLFLIVIVIIPGLYIFYRILKRLFRRNPAPKQGGVS